MSKCRSFKLIIVILKTNLQKYLRLVYEAYYFRSSDFIIFADESGICLMLNANANSIQSLFFFNPKFQPSSCLLWLYSLVFCRTCSKTTLLIFSQAAQLVHPEKLWVVPISKYLETSRYIEQIQLPSCHAAYCT